MTTSHIPTRHCTNPECGGSGWVEGYRDYTYRRYIGNFSATGNDKWTWVSPSEEVTEPHPVAEPCPDCNGFTRSAYEDGRLPYLLAHRNDKPDEEQVRRQNIEKAKAKWDF